MPMIAFKDLSKSFNRVPVFDRISSQISEGEFVSILGPSGCGKSTLLKMVAGLETATSGSLELSEKQISYVFQDATLLPWKPVLENVMLPLELVKSKTSDEELKTLARAALEEVELTGVESLYPHELSGGMRMRVSIARALITKPKLLLLDEPFAALDELIRQRLCELLRALWQKNRMTVIFVTHSISEAAYLADRVLVFSSKPARILADEKIHLPSNRTQDLRGDSRFAEETVRLRTLLESGMGATVQ